MKLIISIILLFSLSCCNGQENSSKKNIPEEITAQRTVNLSTEVPMDFWKKRFQRDGYFLPDVPNTYPTFTYFNVKEGAVSVSFIGKTQATQDLWSIENPSGYFANKVDKFNASSDSKAILNYIDRKNYFIIASFLPPRYINPLEGGAGEFELKGDAKTSFYLYEDNAWKHLKDQPTHEIPIDFLPFAMGLIRNRENNVSAQVQNKTTLKTTPTTTKHSFAIINGTYKADCFERYPSLYITDNEGQMSFYTENNNWVSISVSLQKKENGYGVRYNFLTGVSGKNTDLNWTAFSTNRYIAEINPASEKKIEFRWLGFFDTNEKKFVFTKNIFKSNHKDAFVIWCE